VADALLDERREATERVLNWRCATGQSQHRAPELLQGKARFRGHRLRSWTTRGFPDFGRETRFLGVGPTSLR
jgi:hypothetical protein